MKQTESEQINEEILIAIDRGEAIGANLRKMIGQHDLQPDLPNLLTSFGAICLDVEFGPEINALAGFKPKKLIATEPTGGRAMEHPFADFNGQVIKGVSDHCQIPVDLIRKNPLPALDKIKIEKPNFQVGLITFLNAFPDSQTPTYLTELAKSVAPFLADGGQLIISTVENDACTAERLEESQKLMKIYAQGLSSKFLEKDYGCAGRLFIICQK